MARQRATTTADVVSAAAQMFEARGYRNVTIDDIGQAAGISRPTVYKYIESKPWLLEQMVAAITDEMTGPLHELVSSDLPPREKLLEVIRFHIESSISKRVYYATVFSEQSELPETARQFFKEWSRQVTQDFAALIDEHLASEGLAPQIETPLLANLILGMLTSMYRWYDPSGEITPEGLRDRLMIMLNGAIPQLTDPAPLDSP